MTSPTGSRLAPRCRVTELVAGSRPKRSCTAGDRSAGQLTRTVITGAIFVLCVLAFRRGVVGEIAARLKR